MLGIFDFYSLYAELLSIIFWVLFKTFTLIHWLTISGLLSPSNLTRDSVSFICRWTFCLVAFKFSISPAITADGSQAVGVLFDSSEMVDGDIDLLIVSSDEMKESSSSPLRCNSWNYQVLTLWQDWWYKIALMLIYREYRISLLLAVTSKGGTSFGHLIITNSWHDSNPPFWPRAICLSDITLVLQFGTCFWLI